ncbi:MAG: recombination protein RecR [Candidatus Moranbacteria bacterium RBG_19FT_COMBO_42_6]|nr:MAG: recombination protein RecR [Candidatus Moranbacteria bacterium RBG_19FT_COMBO_42_6]
MYPKSFKKLIDHFSFLPSVGPKMAERLVLFLFKQDAEKLKDFSESLADLKNLKTCQKCFNIAEGTLCEICKNAQRDQKTICVVEDPLDIISIEKTRTYKGLYHVLGGVVLFGNENQDLKINELLERVKTEKIEEIILAVNPTTEGDATALYLKSKLREFAIHPVKSGEASATSSQFNRIKITRLARGLSTGGDIEYADEITLSSALTNRRELI